MGRLEYYTTYIVSVTRCEIQEVMFIEVLSLQRLVYIANFEVFVIHVVFMSFVTLYIHSEL